LPITVRDGQKYLKSPHMMGCKRGGKRRTCSRIIMMTLAHRSTGFFSAPCHAINWLCERKQCENCLVPVSSVVASCVIVKSTKHNTRTQALSNLYILALSGISHFERQPNRRTGNTNFKCRLHFVQI
jgi:hypothetical protein